MDQSSGAEVLSILKELDPRAWVGLAVAIVVFALEIWLDKRYRIFSGFKKKIEQAEAQGRVIQAERVSVSFHSRNDGSRSYTARYEYKMNGRTCQKSLVSRTTLPKAISIYYDEKGRTFTEFDTMRRSHELLSLIIPLLCAALAVKLMG